MVTSLGHSKNSGVIDLKTILISAGISPNDLEALLQAMGLSEDKAEAFISQALSLFNKLGSNSSLEQKLQGVLSMLGVSDAAVQAAITHKVQQEMTKLNESGADMAAVLQQFEAFLANLGLPNVVLIGQVGELLKSSNISTADVLAVVHHVQGFIRGMNGIVAQMVTAASDLFDMVDIPDAGTTDNFDKILGFLRSLGISKPDVTLAINTAVDFFKSLSIADVHALLADVHGLLVVAGFPDGSLQAGLYRFQNDLEAFNSLILS